MLVLQCAIDYYLPLGCLLVQVVGPGLVIEKVQAITCAFSMRLILRSHGGALGRWSRALQSYESCSANGHLIPYFLD